MAVTKLGSDQINALGASSMKIVANVSATSIYKANIWHPISNIATSQYANNMTFIAGAEPGIASIADNGDGSIRITLDSTHTFATGDPVSITGTTDYNGNYLVSNGVDSTHFDIVHAFTTSDGGHTISPDRFLCNKTMGYHCMFTMSATATAADVGEFALMVDATVDTSCLIEHKFLTTDLDSFSASTVRTINAGSFVFFVIKNATGSRDMTIKNGNLNFISAL